MKIMKIILFLFQYFREFAFAVKQQSGVPGRDSNPIPSLPHANNLATPQILRPDSCGCAYQCCPVSIFMCLYADLYIPRIGPHISYSRIDRCIVGIYKSLKLGLWPCNSFLGNICFQFSVLVLCSAVAMENKRCCYLLVDFATPVSQSRSSHF
jgi:hypothetical protein